MIGFTLAEIAAITGGRLEAAADEAGTRIVAPATVDSRNVVSGGLFVAMEGEHVDGHDYVDRAREAGAAAVLASRPIDAPTVLVDDIIVALSALARETVTRLKRDHGCVVIGVTGSQGKTSVKDLIAQMLATAGPTVAAEGSYNNELGVPLTVLRADASTRFLVVEMGARGAGHIAALCDIAQPDVGVVLNVGTAHVGEFGSVEGIAAAKGELVESLDAGGFAVLNSDDPAVDAMRSRTRAHVVTFGLSGSVRVSDVHTTRGCPTFVLSYGGESAAVTLALLGEHQAHNAAAAAAVGICTRMSLTDIAGALAAARPLSAMRMERAVTPGGVTVINDAYNANPASMAAALRTLAALGEGHDTYAVLGPMRELGDASDDSHAGVGALAAELAISVVITVGADAEALAAGAESAPGHTAVERVADVDEAIEFLAQPLNPGDVILVKASRAEGLERVATALLG